MIINGTDYTLPFVALVSFLGLFGIQLLLLRIRRARFLRHLPWLWVIGALVLSVCCLFEGTGGFIDLRSFFALLFLAYAALCAAGIGLAHLVARRRA